VNQIRPRRGGRRVGRRRLFALRQPLCDAGLRQMQRLRDAVCGVVAEAWPRHDERPRAERLDRRVLTRVRSGGHGQRLEERVLGLDLPKPIRVGNDEARTARCFRHRREPGPPDAAAPERRDATIVHHHGAIAGPIEIDGLEVALGIEAEAVEHITRQQNEAGAAGAERDWLAA
jgi:hypothetical protein